MGPLGDQPQPVEVSGAARQEGHQSSVAALGARAPPILAAFLRQSFEEITDEVMDLYDRCLAQSHARASRDLDEFRLAIAKATNEKVLLFRDIGHLVLDPCVRDGELRQTIYQYVPAGKLQASGGRRRVRAVGAPTGR
jgi:hypothetical protein